MTTLPSFKSFIEPVSIDEVIFQAKRQATLRIPRSWESPEVSATYTGKGFIRTAKRQGYIRVFIPISLLEIDHSHLCTKRLERLHHIGGTEDPIWIWIDEDMGNDIYTVEDGNNRCFYGREHGKTHIVAFVTGKLEQYERLYHRIYNTMSPFIGRAV